MSTLWESWKYKLSKVVEPSDTPVKKYPINLNPDQITTVAWFHLSNKWHNMSERPNTFDFDSASVFLYSSFHREIAFFLVTSSWLLKHNNNKTEATQNEGKQKKAKEKRRKKNYENNNKKLKVSVL